MLDSLEAETDQHYEEPDGADIEWDDFEWSKDQEEGDKRVDFVFTGNEAGGPSDSVRRKLGESPTVMACFFQFFTAKLVKTIVTQTDLYAAQAAAKKATDKDDEDASDEEAAKEEEEEEKEEESEDEDEEEKEDGEEEEKEGEEEEEEDDEDTEDEEEDGDEEEFVPEEDADEEDESGKQEEEQEDEEEDEGLEDGLFSRSWIPLSGRRWDFLFFLSSLVFMGLFNNANPPLFFEDHTWAVEHGMAPMGHPFIQDYIELSLNSWQQILRNLHFADNAHTNLMDRAYKVRSLLNSFKRQCLKNWRPGKWLSIDEMMIRFKGRLGWRQFMKDKPIHWGIKLWGIAAASVGYLMTFDIYCGKALDGTAQKGLATTVTVNLIDEIRKKWIWTGGMVLFINYFMFKTNIFCLFCVSQATFTWIISTLQ